MENLKGPRTLRPPQAKVAVFRISERCEKLPTSVMEMLSTHPSIVTASVHSVFTSFDAEETKSKKLAKDLKAVGLKKAQLESNKRSHQFKLDLVVTKESDMKAKYEIGLKAAKDCLKQARDHRRAAEASQNSLEAVAADNERSLAMVKLELEKVRAERVEAKAVEAYQDAFVDTPEYQDLTQRLMTVGGEQLVERIMEAHPEWDLSFLR
ncbi:hypothetical protein Adt_42086 [Abeliophyllum distichum]|uniref:Uncharacterized protein n=1 Tax=Abeliophyllum distichum TaxID=126358 RepID=A0ABD1PQN8_9LAMI